MVLVAAAALAIRSAGQAPAPSSPAAEVPVRLSSGEFEIYSHARTLIDWTPREIKEAPQLSKLRLVEEPGVLPVILKRMGEKASQMIAEFRNIACQEHVYSEWTEGSPIATWREMGPNEVAHHFQYIIIPRPPGDPLMFDEYRTNPKGTPINLSSLADLRLITTNFTRSWAFLITSNQAESRFRYLGEEIIRKQKCYVVGFAQKPDVARNVITFEAGNHSAVILVQGVAWIDEQSFHIPKIETWLLAPRKDIGLENNSTAIDYFPVRPSSMGHVLWLPKQVEVDIHYHTTFVRNIHLYSGFKLFSVSVSVQP